MEVLLQLKVRDCTMEELTEMARLRKKTVNQYVKELLEKLCEKNRSKQSG